MLNKQSAARVRHGWQKGWAQLLQRPSFSSTAIPHAVAHLSAPVAEAGRLQPRLLGQQMTECLAEDGRDPLALPEHQPLADKRIIITAPRQYAQKLAGKLLAAGARPLWVPGVTITCLATQPQALQQLDAACQHLISQSKATACSGPHGRPYTHIAYTSKNGIYAVLQRLALLTGKGIAGAVAVLMDCGAQLCALGADGDVLLQHGLPVHISPPEASTQGLVRELQARGEAAGAYVLCPVPLVAGGLTEPPVVPRFLAALEAAGAVAERVPAYLTTLSPGGPSSCAAEQALLQQGYVHAIAFSSTAEAQGLVALLGGREAITQAILQHDVLLAAHGPYTAQGASQVLGLPVPCVSQQYKTFDGLVSVLEDAFAQRH